jgi:hypothetical protein
LRSGAAVHALLPLVFASQALLFLADRLRSRDVAGVVNETPMLVVHPRRIGLVRDVQSALTPIREQTFDIRGYVARQDAGDFCGGTGSIDSRLHFCQRVDALCSDWFRSFGVLSSV